MWQSSSTIPVTEIGTILFCGCQAIFTFSRLEPMTFSWDMFINYVKLEDGFSIKEIPVDIP